MKFILAAILTGLFAATLRAQAPELKVSKAAVRQEVIAVIEGQLAAFRAKDPAKAQTYAARSFRTQTPPARFEAMVREVYPEIWTNTRVDFGLVHDDGAQATVKARVFGKDGVSAAYDYVLAKEGEVWRIAAVLRSEPRAT